LTNKSQTIHKAGMMPEIDS